MSYVKQCLLAENNLKLNESSNEDESVLKLDNQVWCEAYGLTITVISKVKTSTGYEGISYKRVAWNTCHIQLRLSQSVLPNFNIYFIIIFKMELHGHWSW